MNRALEEWLMRTARRESPSPPEGGYLVVVNDGEPKRIFDSLDQAISWLHELYSRGILSRSMIKPLKEGSPGFLEVGRGFDEPL